jgi:hypothetical protein
MEKKRASTWGPNRSGCKTASDMQLSSQVQKYQLCFNLSASLALCVLSFHYVTLIILKLPDFSIWLQKKIIFVFHVKPISCVHLLVSKHIIFCRLCLKLLYFSRKVWIAQSGYWLGCGLDNQGSVPGRAGFLFLPQHPDWFQGPPSLVSNGYQGCFLNGKDSSPPRSLEVKNEWSNASTSPYVYMIWWPVKHQGQLYL